jgi:hypothetical protein
MWVTCFRAPRVKWPCQGVKGVKFIFHRASLAPPRAVAPRVDFVRRKDPRDVNSRHAVVSLAWGSFAQCMCPAAGKVLRRERCPGNNTGAPTFSKLDD